MDRHEHVRLLVVAVDTHRPQEPRRDPWCAGDGKGFAAAKAPALPSMDRRARPGRDRAGRDRFPGAQNIFVGTPASRSSLHKPMRLGGIIGMVQDIAPTLLAIQGVPVPASLDGRVLSEALKNPPKARLLKSSMRRIEVSASSLLCRA